VADPIFGCDGIDLLDTRFLADNSADYDAVDAFLLLGGTAWNVARQNMLEHALRQKPRPVYVGNPDIAAPVGASLSRQPGYYAHRLADVTGVVPRFFGKPFFNIFEHVFSRLRPNYDPERTVMVGDTLHTDILGGRTAGIKTALITDYGVLSKTDINQAVKLSGIVPDYILPRI
jgi:glycerol 3-phosphatase-2